MTDLIPIPHEGRKPDWLEDDEPVTVRGATRPACEWDWFRREPGFYQFEPDHWAAPVLRLGGTWTPWNPLLQGEGEPGDFSGRVIYRSGEISEDTGELQWFWDDDPSTDIIGYERATGAQANPTPPDASEPITRETLVRAMYEIWPCAVISPYQEEVFGLPLGTILDFDTVAKHGADFGGLERHADAVLPFIADLSRRLKIAEEAIVNIARWTEGSSHTVATEALAAIRKPQETGAALECPSSPDGKHQVDTSMESGPNNCFHCEKPMRA